jgi:hypothetical protein
MVVSKAAQAGVVKVKEDRATKGPQRRRQLLQLQLLLLQVTAVTVRTKVVRIRVVRIKADRIKVDKTTTMEVAMGAMEPV